MSRPIYVSSGAVGFRGIHITETLGKDISSDNVLVALVESPAIPKQADFVDPDTITRPTPSSVIAGKFIDSSVPPGTYRLFGWVTDTPTIEVLWDGDFIEVR